MRAAYVMQRLRQKANRRARSNTRHSLVRRADKLRRQVDKLNLHLLGLREPLSFSEQLVFFRLMLSAKRASEGAKHLGAS